MNFPETITAKIGHLRCGVGSVEANLQRGDKLASRFADFHAVQEAMANLFPDCSQSIMAEGVSVRRDSLGKPYVEWQGEMAEWTKAQRFRAEHCHISNTSDGNLHLVFAVYDKNLVGVGIDAVWLPRLQKAGKDRAYLLRFARQFMSETERANFEELAQNDSDEELLIRVAAHFSLMEAASKACGTGLKIGLGMGRSTSLPKQSLGVKTLAPDVRLLIEGDAKNRLAVLGVNHSEAYWGKEGEFIVALVLLSKNPV